MEPAGPDVVPAIMDELRPRGPGRFVLRALAIASGLGFLTLVMVQAMAFYAPPPEARKKPPGLHGLLGPATKAAPVINPQLREESEHWRNPLYHGATKAGILGPLKRSGPDPAPPRQDAPLPRK